MKYFLFEPINHYTFCAVKSKGVQDIVLSKYRDGDTSTKIFRHLNAGVGLVTIERWCPVKNLRNFQSDFSATKSKLKSINNFDYC